MNTDTSVANIPYKETNNKEMPRTYACGLASIIQFLYSKMRNLINRPGCSNKIHQRVSWKIPSTRKQEKSVDDAFTTSQFYYKNSLL
jgi:hypothetical protein